MTRKPMTMTAEEDRALRTEAGYAPGGEDAARFLMRRLLAEIDALRAALDVAVAEREVLRSVVRDEQMVSDILLTALTSLRNAVGRELTEIVIERDSATSRCADVAQEVAHRLEGSGMCSGYLDDTTQRWFEDRAKVAREIETAIRALPLQRKP